MDAIALSQPTYDRFDKAARHSEQKDRSFGLAPMVGSSGLQVVRLKVFAGAVTADGYPAIVQWSTDNGATWSDYDSTYVRLKDMGGATLAVGSEYRCVCVGVNSSGEVCYQTIVAEDNSGGSGGGDGGCCASQPTDEYHPTENPFTSSFDIFRPFGAGAATATGIQGRLIADFTASRLAVDLPDWTHILIYPMGTDLRDGHTRLVGSNGLNYADGDEVRIPSTSSSRYVVVFCESVNKGLTGPDIYEYCRAFLMRHAI